MGQQLTQALIRGGAMSIAIQAEDGSNIENLRVMIAALLLAACESDKEMAKRVLYEVEEVA